MAADAGHLEAITALSDALQAEGFEPVLVGGMALVILGSPRVTKDFDFLVSTQGPPVETLVKTMYRHRLQLVTKLNPAGEVVRTVDNPRVAAAKVKADPPRSLYFFDGKTGLRVDLLLDFPLPSHAVAGRAARIRLKSGSLRVADPKDLLRLKEIAYADRKSAADAHDLDFLRRSLKSS